MPNPVSVLFSEPKIPQFTRSRAATGLRFGFSALQRAENSSIVSARDARASAQRFQCSSASRKFLNFPVQRLTTQPNWSFSALQRAENSSMVTFPLLPGCVNRAFQCSSASRKFLNAADYSHRCRTRSSFSALQRAENSSMLAVLLLSAPSALFQCSSASRKFLNSMMSTLLLPLPARFSALQRAENSSIVQPVRPTRVDREVSVLFSEPKIPQFRVPRAGGGDQPRFQCSSASRKFLNCDG